MHGTVAGNERGDEAERRLAVERAAPLLEQGRLLDEAGVAVELEQPALDLGDRLCARHAVELLGEHLVVGVEVTEVVGRHRTQLVEQAPRQLERRCDLVAVLQEQRRQHVTAVQHRAAHPREVVEPDLVNDEPAGLDPEPGGPPSLEADRHVAEPDRAMSAIE